MSGNGNKFMWFEQYTNIIDSIPDIEMRDKLSASIQHYGLSGEEPKFEESEWMLKVAFESMRFPLDNSRKKSEAGRKGGIVSGESKRAKCGDRSDKAPSEANPKQTQSKLKANPKQTQSRNEAEPNEGKGREVKGSEEIFSPSDFSEIVSYLNGKAGSSFKATSKKTQSLIKARFNEGFTVDDFKRVIDTKTAQWKHDCSMSKYLRPETLFGTKFEGYLNERSGDGKRRHRDIEPAW